TFHYGESPLDFVFVQELGVLDQGAKDGEADLGDARSGSRAVGDDGARTGAELFGRTASRSRWGDRLFEDLLDLAQILDGPPLDDELRRQGIGVALRHVAEVRVVLIL